MNRFQQLVGGLLNAAPDLGAGVARGVTADVLGTPVDTLNTIRQGLLMPAQAGNPVARGIVGLLGPVQQTGTSDYFAQQMGLPEGQGMAYEAGRMLSPSPSDLMSLARRAPSIQELITYHGTPHQFPATEANPLGEFDASKIGTGEGAQAYGHGIYYAESPEVAEGYRTRLSKNVTVDGKKLQSIPSDSPSAEAHNMVVRFIQDGMSPTEAIAQTNKYWIDAAEEMRTFKKLHPELVEKIDEEIASRLKVAEATKTIKPESFFKDPGSLYKADLPDEMIDRMLDWDKPLSEQPKSIRKALEASGVLNYADAYFKANKKTAPTGGNLHDFLKYSGYSQNEISDMLSKHGIPGIKYADAGSRGQGGSGTRNFVVFPGEEKKVKILERK